MPVMGEWRRPPCGCNSGVASIWERRSGEAPSKNHESPSSVIATWVWERGLPWKVPARTAQQFAQAQFHCGNAPPAAEPRILTRISREFTAWDLDAGNFGENPGRRFEPRRGRQKLQLFYESRAASVKDPATQAETGLHSAFCLYSRHSHPILAKGPR